MSSKELAGSPSSSILPEAGLAGASLAGTAVPVALGAQAANSAEPVTMPAALRKSRRDRYCEKGVISDDLTGTDLYLLFITASILCIPQQAMPGCSLQFLCIFLRQCVHSGYGPVYR